MATPAEGPSLGTAPAGTCRWMSDFSKISGSRPNSPARLRSQERAASADSRITSPSEPVSLSSPLPGMRVDSTKRMSPPAGVQARPTATPGCPARSAISGSNRTGPSSSARSSGAIVTGPVSSVLGDAARDLPAHRADLALEVAHAGLARVAAGSARAASRRAARTRSRRCRSARAAAAPGSAWRSRPSPPRCSPAARSPPCGRAAPRGTGSIRFAVAMKSTCERSKGTSR